MALKWFGSDFYAMKTIRLLSLTGIALVGFAQLTSAGPHTGGFGGGHVGGGGHFGGSHFGGYAGVPHGAPAFSGGARFSGPSTGPLTRAPQQFYYYNGTRMSGATQHAFVRQPPSGSATANAGSRSTMTRQQNRAGSPVGQNTPVGNSQVAAANRQPNRAGAIAGRNRPSDPRTLTAANRQSFLRNHAFARHDSNWHHDWDKRHAHFDHNRVFVFVGGSWWGLYPGDYYPYYASADYPDDYNGSYPYDYSGYPYDYYGGDYPYDYSQDNNDNDSTNTASDQYASNPTVGAVQSGLAKLGYYNGAVDGVLGDQTEAALARYQQDRDLSVTGTVDAATLQSLGLR